MKRQQNYESSQHSWKEAWADLRNSLEGGREQEARSIVDWLEEHYPTRFAPIQQPKPRHDDILAGSSGNNLEKSNSLGRLQQAQTTRWSKVISEWENDVGESFLGSWQEMNQRLAKAQEKIQHLESTVIGLKEQISLLEPQPREKQRAHTPALLAQESAIEQDPDSDFAADRDTVGLKSNSHSIKSLWELALARLAKLRENEERVQTQTAHRRRNYVRALQQELKIKRPN